MAASGQEKNGERVGNSATGFIKGSSTCAGSIWWLVMMWPLVLSSWRYSGEGTCFWTAAGSCFSNSDRNGLSVLTPTHS